MCKLVIFRQFIEKICYSIHMYNSCGAWAVCVRVRRAHVMNSLLFIDNITICLTHLMIT